MKLEERTPSGRETDPAALDLLNRLRMKLHARDISTARLSAFALSWRQEDGFDILKEALFGDFPRTTKKAAAYGLRSMKGRMKKMATELLEEGKKHRDRTTYAACVKALQLMRGEVPPKKTGFKRKPRGRVVNGNNVREINGNRHTPTGRPSINRPRPRR